MTDLACTVESCEVAAHCRGLCPAHYDRWRKTGDVRANVAVRRKGSAAKWCVEPDCGRKAEARDRCSTHYKHLRFAGKACVVSDCGRRPHISGYCRSHYTRWKQFGDPEAGKPIGLRDGRVVTTEGYVLLYEPTHSNANAQGYVREHAKVMSEVVGRPLLRGENVHHINGVKDDNRPENLELWVTMQPTGQRPADLVRYALEILERYGAATDAEMAVN